MSLDLLAQNPQTPRRAEKKGWQFTPEKLAPPATPEPRRASPEAVSSDKLTTSTTNPTGGHGHGGHGSKNGGHGKSGGHAHGKRGGHGHGKRGGHGHGTDKKEGKVEAKVEKQTEGGHGHRKKKKGGHGRGHGAQGRRPPGRKPTSTPSDLPAADTKKFRDRSKVPCRFFAKAACNKGDQCPFSHAESVASRQLNNRKAKQKTSKRRRNPKDGSKETSPTNVTELKAVAKPYKPLNAAAAPFIPPGFRSCRDEVSGASSIADVHVVEQVVRSHAPVVDIPQTSVVVPVEEVHRDMSAASEQSESPSFRAVASS